MKLILFLAVFFNFSANSAEPKQTKTQAEQQASDYSKSYGGLLGGMFGTPPATIPYESKKIKVKVDDKSVSCDLDSGAKTYICPNEGHPILVKYGGYGFSAIGKDEQNSVVVPKITHVEAEDGKVLYEATSGFPGMGGFGMMSGNAKAGSDNISKILSINGFFADNGFPGSEKTVLSSPSPEYKKLEEMFLQDRDNLMEEVNRVYREKNYSVELEDGQKINCERGDVANLPEAYKNYEKQMGQKFQCGSFKCSPLKVDGKDYQVTMLYESTPGSFSNPTIHLMDKDGIGPKKSVKKVTSPNSKTPLVDNTYALENANNSYNKNYISSMLPQSLKEDREKIMLYKDPVLEQLIAYNTMICNDNKALDQLMEGKKKLVAKLGELELAEFIQVLGNGSLVGSFVDPTLAPQLGCLYQGVYLNEEAAKNLDRLKKNIHPDSHVEQTISMDRATELFNKAAKMEDIAWKYKPDGCYARAHLMARRFEAEGVRVDKVWIKGNLYVPGTEPLIQWNFHVAPIVYVDDGKGKVTKMVIDPSLFSKPVTVEEWDNKMSKRTAKGSVITAFPFPENSAFMERSTLSFSSSDPYLPRDSINMSEEDKMQMANETMKMYKQVEPK